MARVRSTGRGLGVFFPAVVALLSAISFGAVLGWGSALIVGLFVAACVLGVLFIWHERRDSDPMMDLRFVPTMSTSRRGSCLGWGPIW